MRGDTIESILRRFVATAGPDFMFSDEDNDRIQELADKCTEGELTADERSEYEAYVETGQLLALIQARAIELAKRPSSVR